MKWLAFWLCQVVESRVNVGVYNEAVVDAKLNLSVPDFALEATPVYRSVLSIH